MRGVRVRGTQPERLVVCGFEKCRGAEGPRGRGAELVVETCWAVHDSTHGLYHDLERGSTPAASMHRHTPGGTPSSTERTERPRSRRPSHAPHVDRHRAASPEMKHPLLPAPVLPPVDDDQGARAHHPAIGQDLPRAAAEMPLTTASIVTTLW